MSTDLDVIPEVTERDSLKAKADFMGLTYKANIPTDKLRELVHPIEEEEETDQSIAMKAYQEANKLIRVRLTCMNPSKKDWDGEIITVGNSVIPTIRKYVPFNVESYHLPSILLDVLKDRMYQTFVTVGSGNSERKEAKLMNEFAIQILPDLTQDELDDLAQTQAARGIQ